MPGTSKHRPQAPQLSASPALAAQPVDEDWAQVCLGHSSFDRLLHTVHDQHFSVDQHPAGRCLRLFPATH